MMKKVFLTLVIINIISVLTFAKEANIKKEYEGTTKTVVTKPEHNCRLVRVTIIVDCDGDRRADYVYSGLMDTAHIGAMAQQLIDSCE